jgi:hypothetical protein
MGPLMYRLWRWLAVGPPDRPEPDMTLPRTAAGVLSERVTFETECIDRMYLNVYVPQGQYQGGLIGFLRTQLGCPIASTAPLMGLTDWFGQAVGDLAVRERVPIVKFVKNQRKDDVMHEHLARFTATEGVLFIGWAQEKARIFHTEKRRDAEGKSYPWIVQAPGMVKHWYFYCVDDDFGPFFIKFCSYFPFNAKLCLNGNHWAQRQAAKAGLTFEALDNGFAAVDDPARLQAICDQLGPEHIDALLRKWLARLPHPYTADNETAGYRYDISILQAEFSLTQVLDSTTSGRIFFEQVIRDNLDIGRPDQVGLIFDRRIIRGRRHYTPGQFRTRVITDGVTPSLHVDYKKTKIKQYHKLGKALRTETTINDTKDFAIGKRLHNLPALREVGFSANRRLLRVLRISHNPADGAAALTATCQPVLTPTGQRVAGLPLTHPRTQALLAALCMFRLQPNGFANRDFRYHLAPLLGITPEQLSTGQISYDLRRLRHHQLIERIPHTHRYRVTDTGIRHALFLTRVHQRILHTGLAELGDHHPPDTPTRLQTAARTYNKAIDDLAKRAGLTT